MRGGDNAEVDADGLLLLLLALVIPEPPFPEGEEFRGGGSSSSRLRMVIEIGSRFEEVPHMMLVLFVVFAFS